MKLIYNLKLISHIVCRVCEPFSKASQNDMKNFYNSIADDFADLVQYNEDNRISGDKMYKNLTINSVSYHKM